MPLDGVYDALVRYIVGEPPNQVIDLVAAASDPALTLLAADLEALRIDQAFVVNVVELARKDSRVTLDGTSSWTFAGGIQTNVRVELAAADLPEATMSLSLHPTASPWTFGSTFLELAPTRPSPTHSLLQALRIDKPAFVAVAGGAAERQPLFSGELGAHSLDPALSPFFGPYPLELSGSVNFPQPDRPYPTMVLSAVSADTAIGLPQLDVSRLELCVVSETNSGDPELSLYRAETRLELRASVSIAGRSGVISAELSGSERLWPLSLTLPVPGLPIGDSLGLLAGLLGVATGDLDLPESFPALNEFALTEIDAGVYPDGPALDHVGITIESSSMWRPPVPFLNDKIAIGGLGARLVAFWIAGQATPAAISGSVFGRIRVGEVKPLNLLVTAYLPNFVIEALQNAGEEADLRDIVSLFLGCRPTWPDDPPVLLSSMSLVADPQARTFAATLLARFDASLPIGGGLVTLSTIGLGIRAGAGSMGAYMTALFVLGESDDDEAPKFSLSARYDSVESWTFEGGLQPGAPLQLSAVAERFVGNRWLPPEADVQIDALWMLYAIKDNTYAFNGALSARWSPEIFGRVIAMTGGVEVAIRKDSAAGAVGSITGTFSIDRLSATAALSLSQPNQPTYLFRVAWDGTWISAVTSWRTDPITKVARQVITLTLGGKTLGELITYLANLALPESNFTLDAPWDLLNRVELSAFSVTIDPTAGAVELAYDASIDLGFASVSRIGLRYSRVNGQGSVEMLIAGSVIGRSYPVDKPLSWDILSQSAPVTPGTGTGGTLEVRFLGIGQRVALTGGLPTTVSEAVARLAATMKEPASPTAKPLPAGIGFSSTAGWLLALDASVLGTVDLAMVFADPTLYGLSVGLRGDRAGPLAGLRFEVLYRKLSEGLGVYRIELRVPDAFRRIDLGVLSVTIGIVIVEIYTNGDFKIDAGFPYNENFSRSFGLSYLPFVGRGGFYLGLLDGTTSSRVPRVTNGAFSPVLEVGIGLSIGVGKEFSAGPVSGSISVEARVIFEGVFAWFNPRDTSVKPAMYVWVAGLAGVYGKLSGRADFAVIVVNVTVDAWAEARVVFELYRPTVFALNVGARVYASIDFWLFTAEFSFELQLNASITVGADQPTPWLLASAPPAAALTGNGLPPLTRRPARRLTLVAAAARPIRLRPRNWASVRRRIVDAELLPAFTATGITVGWDSPPPPAISDGTSPYRVVFGLGVRSEPSRRLARGSACDLVELLLRYAIGLVETDDSRQITIAELETLAELLRSPSTIDGPFGIEQLSSFFAQTLVLRIGGRPKGEPAPFSGTAIPLPPFLRWRAGAQHGDLSRDFRIGPEYIRDVASYIDQYLPGGARDARVSESSAVESFASWAFRDWCLLVARQAVQAAQEALTAWQVRDVATLRAAARAVPARTVPYAVRIGDTLMSVAAAIGASPEELQFLEPDIAARIAKARPNSVLRVRLGASPGTVAGDNADLHVRVGLRLSLGEIRYQVQAHDTVASIAARLGVPGPASVVANCAADPRLLVADAPLTVPRVLTAPRGRSPVLIAATYFTRYEEPALPELQWYAEALADLNSEGLRQIAGASGMADLPIGMKLMTPKGYERMEPGSWYRTIEGDTIVRIASALALRQNYHSGEGGPRGWARFRNDVVASRGRTIPRWPTRVRPGESLDALGARLVADAATVATWFARARGLLAPLAVLPVAGVSGRTRPHDTLAQLASRYALSVDDLGSRISEVALFSPRTVLVARHLVTQEVGAVVSRVSLPTTTQRIVGLAARFLLGGLRLPEPAVVDGRPRASDNLIPFAELTRQQLVGPVPDSARGPDVALKINYEATGTIAWIDLRTTTARPSGAISRGRSVRSLSYEFTNAELAKAYPPLGMSVHATSGPGPLEPATTVPRTYGLDRRIALQSTVELPVRTPSVVGVASLWPFPSALVERAKSRPADRYDVVRLETRDDLDPAPRIARDARFGAFVPFAIRRAGQQAVYELVGVAPGDQDTVRAVAADSARSSDKAFLLVRPAPDASEAAGRLVWPAEPTSTYLVLTNESTDTALPPAGADNGGRRFHASLAEPRKFARLLWQGSIVGGAGYYLGTEQPLPPAVFDDSGVGHVAMLYLPNEGGSIEGLALDPFSNVALLGSETRPSVHALYVECAGEGDSVTRALVGPGTTGFSMVLRPPEASDHVGRLFSLVGWSMPAAKSTPHAPRRPAPPTYGRRSAPRPLRPWDRARRARRLAIGRTGEIACEDHLHFETLVPVARYGPASPMPDVPGLPSPHEDPYRAVGVPPLGSASFELTFSDVFGNRSAPAATVEAPLRYVDDLSGPGLWPALVSWFDVGTESDGSPALTVTLGPQPGAWGRDRTEPPSAVAARLATQADRYRTAVYQLLPPRVRTSVRSNITAAPEETVDPWAIWRYAVAGYLATTAVAALEPLRAGPSVAAIVASNNVTVEDLAAANADIAVASAYDVAKLRVPAVMPFTEGDDAASLLARRPRGWPRPSNAADLLMRNATLPLRTGAVLDLPAVSVAVRGRSLVDVATDAATTPELLAEDSRAIEALSPTFVFDWDGVKVAAAGRGRSSLARVVSRFAAEGVHVTVRDLARKYAATPDLLRADSRLTTRHYVASSWDTLAENDSGQAPETLAKENAHTANLFSNGTLITFGDFARPSARPDETLGEFATRFGCPLASLLRSNADVRLRDGIELVVPGATRPPDDSIRVPYAMAAADSLDNVAARFGADRLQIGQANAAMPATLVPGRSVVIATPTGTARTTTVETDSLASVLERLRVQRRDATLADVLANLAPAPGAFVQGAVLSCPAGMLPAEHDVSPAAAARRFGVDPIVFAEMNASATGLVRPGTRLTAAGVTVRTLPGETLASLVRSFAFALRAQGVDTNAPTLGEVIAANIDEPLFRAAARVLVPPAPLIVTVGASAAAPVEPVAPLRVTLEVARDRHLLDPAFCGGPVESLEQFLRPPTSPGPTGALSLAGFAGRFNALFPRLRLATSQTSPKDGDLWVVSFDRGGIEQVDFHAGGQARFFGLRPLYPELVARTDVQIAPLQADGTLGDPAATSFTGVDVETWARRFLADIDRFLAPPFIAPLYPDKSLRPLLDRILELKATLATRIADGVGTVLAGDRASDEAARQAAVDRVRQALLVSLADGYATPAIVQFECSVTSPWVGATDQRARLVGGLVRSADGAAEDSFTLTDAKLSLDEHRSFLTARVGAANLPSQTSVRLVANYDVGYLEHRVVGDLDGYETSQWLTFLPALTGPARPSALATSVLDPITIPIPLRAFPLLPQIVRHLAAPSGPSDPPPVEAAARWDYSVTYAHEHAPQDEVSVQVRFNSPRPDRRQIVGPDVAAELAQYEAVAGPLWDLLASIVGTTTAPSPSPSARNALETFEHLVGRVAAAWGLDQPAGLEVESEIGVVFEVALRLRTISVGERRMYDSVTMAAGVTGPGPMDAWPELTYRPPDGPNLRLTRGPATGGECTYWFPAGVAMDPSVWPEITLHWAALPVARFERARAAIAVTRNAQLLGAHGPETDAAFVMRTGSVGASDVVTPLLRWSAPIDITPFGESLGEALRAVVTTLFGGDDVPVTVSAALSYTLVSGYGGQDSMMSTLPARLFSLPASRVPFDVPAGLAAWLEENPLGPVADRREWRFGLSLDAQAPDADRRPLLQISSLIYRLGTRSN